MAARRSETGTGRSGRPGRPGATEHDGGYALSRRTLFGAGALVVATALAPAATAASGSATASGPGVVPGPGAGGGGTLLTLPEATLPPGEATPAVITSLPLRAEARDGSTQVVRSDAPLELVAVTWTGEAPDVVEIRSTDAEGRFGEWLTVDVAGERDDLPARTAPGGGTDPVWVGDRTAVEVRATRGGRPVTEGLAIAQIDPGTSENDAAIGARARERAGAARSGRPPRPAYVSRAQWGANEKMMSWPPRYSRTTRAVTIHHTAESNDYTPEQSARIVRGIYNYHVKSNGWGDIGYHVLVDKYGTIFEGRAGGLDRPVTGAHAGGFNAETFGVALMGNLMRTYPTRAQGSSVAALCAWKLGGMYRDPSQRITLTSSGGGTSKFAKGRTTQVPVLFAHRDVGNTSCPGDFGYRAMDSLRRDVSVLIAEAATDVRAEWAVHADLGEPGRVEGPTADGRGRFTDFEFGSIYWSPETGAHRIGGAIRDAWRARGAERSTLGMPTGAEYRTNSGRAQAFENGVLRWNTTTGLVRSA